MITKIKVKNKILDLDVVEIRKAYYKAGRDYTTGEMILGIPKINFLIKGNQKLFNSLDNIINIEGRLYYKSKINNKYFYLMEY